MEHLYIILSLAGFFVVIMILEAIRKLKFFTHVFFNAHKTDKAKDDFAFFSKILHEERRPKRLPPLKDDESVEAGDERYYQEEVFRRGKLELINYIGSVRAHAEETIQLWGLCGTLVGMLYTATLWSGAGDLTLKMGRLNESFMFAMSTTCLGVLLSLCYRWAARRAINQVRESVGG